MERHSHAGQDAWSASLSLPGWAREIAVFVSRLNEQLSGLEQVPYAAKFGGATGNFNAHYVAYPDNDWHTFGNDFVGQKLGLKRSYPTTQIEHYDYFAALFDAIKRVNTILLDFSKDVWQYVAMNYFKQRINPNEVGSSAMPHKVNPIDFEKCGGVTWALPMQCLSTSAPNCLSPDCSETSLTPLYLETLVVAGSPHPASAVFFKERLR